MVNAVEHVEGRPYLVTVETFQGATVIEDAAVTSYGLVELLRAFGRIPFSSRRAFVRSLGKSGELSTTTPPGVSRRYRISAKVRDV